MNQLILKILLDYGIVPHPNTDTDTLLRVFHEADPERHAAFEKVMLTQRALTTEESILALEDIFDALVFTETRATVLFDASGDSLTIYFPRPTGEVHQIHLQMTTAKEITSARMDSELSSYEDTDKHVFGEPDRPYKAYVHPA